MKKLLPAFIFCFLFTANSFSQSPALQCSEAEIICDFDVLNGFSFTMPVENSPGNQPNPICPDGGAPHNISWIGFIAHEGDYTIKLYGTDCSGSTIGIEGVQYGLYTDCTFASSVFCQPDCSLDTLFISSDVLEVGSEYLMFVDGCSGSVCDIIIEVEGDYEGDYCDPVSTNDLGNTPHLRLYPNPASELLFIESKFEFVEFLIFDSRSQLKIHQSLDAVSFEANVNVDGWSRGVYFIETRSKEGSHFSKFIVE
jgi:hypothetical protein